MKHLSQRRRAQIGLFTVIILNLGVYIWSIVMQVRFKASDPGAIDWDSGLYPTAFLPYFFVQTTGPLSQSYMYWLLSSFATDAQGKSRFHLNQLQVTNEPVSQCSERSRFPLPRSCWSSHCVWHEYQDIDKPTCGNVS